MTGGARASVSTGGRVVHAGQRRVGMGEQAGGQRSAAQGRGEQPCRAELANCFTQNCGGLAVWCGVVWCGVVWGPIYSQPPARVRVQPPCVYAVAGGPRLWLPRARAPLSPAAAGRLGVVSLRSSAPFRLRRLDVPYTVGI